MQMKAVFYLSDLMQALSVEASRSIGQTIEPGELFIFSDEDEELQSFDRIELSFQIPDDATEKGGSD